MKNRKSIVVAKLPNAGLGNKMLTFSRAFCYAKEHDLKLYTVNWISFQMGTLLRLERSLRIYNYFEKREILSAFRLFSKKIVRKREHEGALFNSEKKYYIFSKIFIDNDYFIGLRENRVLIKEELIRILKKDVQNQIEKLVKPDVSLHIRRGDFKNGSTLTGLSYFIDVLKFIKSKVQRELNIVVFSDGNDEELSDILKIEGVSRAIKQPDIVDIFQMSKSKIFVPSIGSTFSYWGAFLSNGIVIRHKDEWHSNFLDDTFFNVREFTFSIENEKLSQELKKII
jgi:hypothetical protein